MLPSQPNQSLIDGINCLHELARAKEPVGVREMARRLNLEPTRANRLLKTLAHIGIAAQTKNKKYVPGAGIHVLAAHSIFASGLIRKVIPRMEVFRPYGLIMALGVLWNDSVAYLYHAEPRMAIAEGIGRISLYPATRSSIGLILLSHMKETEVRTLFRKKEIPGFQNDVKLLLDSLRIFKQQEYALVENENKNKSIACAIGDPPIAGIAVSGIIHPSKFEKIKKTLFQTAREINYDLK